jgi:hypothetical protein
MGIFRTNLSDCHNEPSSIGIFFIFYQIIWDAGNP